MNILTDPNHLKNLLKSLGFRPKDYLGQNFLVSEDVLEEIVNAGDLKKTDTVIEIGPGLGVLTQRLVQKAGRVIALEKDGRLVTALRQFFGKQKNLEILEQDVLKYNFENAKPGYKVVANIPYYLTSHLLQMLLGLANQPTLIVFLVQKEVGERLTAPAGELSLLGISVQVFADADIIAMVPKENFWPKPKVDSTIVWIKPSDKYPQIHDHKLFFRMLKIAFAGKRKQIHNTLANGLKLPKEQVLRLLVTAKIDPTLRPQDLTIEQWIDLYSQIKGTADSVQRSVEAL